MSPALQAQLPRLLDPLPQQELALTDARVTHYEQKLRRGIRLLSAYREQLGAQIEREKQTTKKGQEQ